MSKYNPKTDKVEVTIEPVEGSWRRALDLARRTVGKKPLDKEPSNEWKRKILLQEHSPIRAVEYIIHFEDIRQWVSVHLVRHWLGFIPFVHSQRQDRRVLDCERDELPQGSLNDMDVLVNAQALINVSKKRLCRKASPETRHAWELVKNDMKYVDPMMASVMVPECIYRGFCPYGKESCGYYNSQQGQEERERYALGETPKDFIRKELEKALQQFPQATFKYQQVDADHFIQVDPEVYDNPLFSKWEEDMWCKFVDIYPYDAIVVDKEQIVEEPEFVVKRS